jgi:CRP-like cAMP-binding protein
MAKSTSEDEMLNLYRELQYINLPAKRTLFRSGAIGRNFYVILRGSVWVHHLRVI